MEIYYKILKFLVFISLYYIHVVNATVTLEYNDNGVLRKDSDTNCNINFANFGIESNIKNIALQFSDGKNTSNNIPGKRFNIIVSKLINGNYYINEGVTVSKSELSNLIKVTQGNSNVNFEVSSDNKDYIEIIIKNLETCEDLTVKQTYKEPAITYTYVLYDNVIPSPINKGFPSSMFGPSSNNTPYTIIHWNMNGLDEIREKCNIYISYGSWSSNHWTWYVSTENKNLKKCTNKEMYSVAQKYYVDYDKMTEIFGNHYEGYVIKKEGYSMIHMDGITDNKYMVEVYQTKCGNQNGDQVACTVPSAEKLTFKGFTREIVKNCLNLIIDINEDVTWTVDNNGVNGKFKDYSILVQNTNFGSLPTKKDESVTYKQGTSTTANYIARFKVTLTCVLGSTYKDDNCRCRGMKIIKNNKKKLNKIK